MKQRGSSGSPASSKLGFGDGQEVHFVTSQLPHTTTMQHTTKDGEDNYRKKGPISTTVSWLVVVNWSPNHTPEMMPRGIRLWRRVGEQFRRKSPPPHTTAAIAEITKEKKKRTGSGNNLMASVLGTGASPPPSKQGKEKVNGVDKDEWY